MMSKIITTATVLLCLQLGLIVAMNMNKDDYQPYSPSDALVAFEPSTVDAVALSGRDGELTLRKIEGAWYLDDTTVPADTALVQVFIDKIAGFRKGLAVATSAEAAQRFEVDAAGFAHRLVLRQGEEDVATLFFGTSPGFRQIHVRAIGREEVYTVALNSNELAPMVEQWIDKNMLKLNRERIQEIVLPEFTLSRDDADGWQVSPEQAGISAAEAGRLVDRISNISVHGFATKDAAAEKTAREPELAFTVLLVDGERLDWRLWREDDTTYFVMHDGRDYLATISAWQLEEIFKAAKNEGQEEEAAAGDGQPVDG